VELFDAMASPPSVTHRFNTTLHGRLTLNVLLFARFEREITSERIRGSAPQAQGYGQA
jgi:DNA invertase Pin-like site-specific DNA recombinase